MPYGELNLSFKYPVKKVLWCRRSQYRLRKINGLIVFDDFFKKIFCQLK